jgi:hypothetical protein
MRETITRLQIYHFDSLENDERKAEYLAEEKFFSDEGQLSGHGVCAEYLQTLTINPYLAWNGDVYPKFNVKTIYTNPNKLLNKDEK